MDSVEKKNLQESSEEKKKEISMDPVEAVEKIFDTDLFQLRPSMDSVEKNVQLQEESSEEKKNVQTQEESSMEAVERILNYSFSNKSLLKETLKPHGVGKKSLTFQRLEFLGDSVLGFVFTNYFHLTFPDLKDNELVELRMVNTCNNKFARVAVKRGLFPFVICTSRKSTRKRIKAFSEAVSKEDDLVWYQGSMLAPKILADFVEAIAGAVYIDLDFDLQRLWEIFKALLDPIFMPDDFRRRYEPIATLHRLGKNQVVFKYCRDDETRIVAKVYLDDKFIASGHGKSESHARMAAAKEALQKLSECMPIQKTIDESSSPDVKRKVEDRSLDVKNGHGKVEETPNLQMQESLEETPNLQMQESLEETPNLQMQESLEETPNLQMQESLEEMPNLQMQESLEETPNLQMQESLEETPNLQMEKKNLQIASLEAVEKILNYSFSNKSLLKEAITYKSGMKLRLKILGNTALCLAFTKYLYFAYPNLSTMGLDQLRSANIVNERSARVAVKHGLDKFLIYNRSSHRNFDKKVKLFSEAVSKEDGPVPYGGLVIAPSILGDLVVTIAGAVYVDVNFHVARFWEICKGLFEPLYTVDDLWWQSQPVLTLLRLGDKRGKQIDFRYRKGPNEQSTCEVYLDDELIACGRSKCSGDAKRIAAKTALMKLSERMPFEIEDETVIENTEIEDARWTLNRMCRKRKWPKPIYSVVAQDHVKGYVCSAEIETQTEEGTLFIKGDSRKKKKLAEINSAFHMVRALEFSTKDDLRS